jgi:hypothetical protein
MGSPKLSMCLLFLFTALGCGHRLEIRPSKDVPLLSSPFISCSLPALTERQILEFAKVGFGSGFDPPPGLPEPNRLVEVDGCRYRYTQSIVYTNKGVPSALDGIDTTRTIYISRDGISSDW